MSDIQPRRPPRPGRDKDRRKRRRTVRERFTRRGETPAQEEARQAEPPSAESVYSTGADDVPQYHWHRELTYQHQYDPDLAGMENNPT